MKKNLLTIVLLGTAAAAAISCSNKDNLEPAASERVPMQFSAGTPAITKTAIAEDGTSVVWSEGDAIGIFDTQINKFDLIAGDGTSEGRFSGFALPDAEYYALYPYDETASIAGGIISATLPSAQYSTADGTFSTMLNPAVAKADASNSLAFEHVAAMFKVNVEGLSSAVKSISLSADQSLSGAYKVDMNQETWSAVTEASETPAGVSLVGKDDADLAAGPYYLVILPGSYTNLTLTVALADGTEASSDPVSIEVAARDIKETTVDAAAFVKTEFGFAPTEDTYFIYKGASKTYTVNASAGAAWTLAADSDDVTFSATEGTGTQTVTVTLPYSKYIYEKSYTLTLSAAGQEAKTLTVKQQSCVDPNQSSPVGLTSTDGTLTAENAAAMVKTYDKFKYGTFIIKFSEIDLTSGFFYMNNWEGETYLAIRLGGTGNTNHLSAGGNITLSWGRQVNFGFDNGWNDRWGVTPEFTDYPAVNDMKVLKIEMFPTTRTGTEMNQTLSRKVYINDVLVCDNSTNVGDIWQNGSSHEGFQYNFGIGSDDEHGLGNGSMTIESFEFIPYE